MEGKGEGVTTMEKQWTAPRPGRSNVGAADRLVYFYYEVETGKAIARVEDHVDHSTAVVLRSRNAPMLFVGPDHTEKAKSYIEHLK